MQTISLGQAFAHCFSTASYIVWLVVAFLIMCGLLYIAIKKIEGISKYFVIGAALIVFAVALFLRPAEVAANTSQDNAAKNIFIGY